jgi:two-component system response regulator PilR (NtrC family)
MWDPWANARAWEDLRGRLKWFLFGRVAIISCFLAVIGLLYLRSGEERYVVPVNSLLVIVVGTYVFSMVSAVLLPRLQRLGLFTYLQITFDILLITGGIFLTGGVDSPFPFLYGLPIINAASLLLGNSAAISATLSVIAYDSLVGALSAGWLAPVYPAPPSRFGLEVALRFATTNVTLFLVAYLASVLTRRLHAMEGQVLEQRAERDRLALLQETLSRTIGSALITTDPDGRVTAVDRAIEALVHHPGNALTGQDIGTLFPPLRLAASARLRFLQSTGALEPIEFTYQAHEGSVLQLRCTAAPLRDTYGHPIGALYVLQDVTQLKEIERRKEAVPKLEEQYRDDLAEAMEISEAADGLYGTSAPMTRIRELIERVAKADATVLLTGESGTGKELVARAIHAHSARATRPFVAINCGAIPENLIESELFGHVRGAFTGAVADRAGCFRVADSGTIFLDEIGELPLHLQVKLLRVLQERVFRPVGSETNVAVNVRVVAASNRDLQAEVRAGRFREDLFYRLNVISIELPPLRERREDIPLLVRHFLRQFSEQHGRQVSRFSVGAGRILLQYDYPGNIRELENIVEHAVALCDTDTASEDHLPAYLVNDGRKRPERAGDVPAALPGGPAAPPSLAEPIDLDRDLAEYEKAILLRALDQAGGVKKRAAELLGINYRSLRHRLQKYGLSELGDDSAE